ncbi:mucin-2-like isoform X2 [Culex pipiens pallens]|uniref:mucin-2-like isoform X2 n=1 Tax=Culex pipiens pallens TaxID=42434 RepID=UPI0022AAB6E8|nr:mucin-2-like isoform X2 [Culex pipiens pallens]
MRNVWIVVASGLLAFANFVKSQETGRTLYSSRYDNLDIDTILSSNRLVNNYVDCLLSRKPCPPEGKDLKRILPEALRTKCGRCSSTQKENALKIITTLYYSYPDQYQALRERWDPSGEYHRRFEEYLRGIQFNQIGGNGNGNGGPSERPVRNDFDRDQSQILLQTLILSTTTAQPPVPEQRPTQLASAQLTQPVAPITSTTTTSSTTTTTTTTTPTTSTSTTTMSTPPVPTTPNSSVEPSSSTSSSTSTTSASSSGGESGDEAGGGSEPPTSIPATDSFRPFNNLIQYRPCFTRCPSRYRPWSQQQQYQYQPYQQYQPHFFNANNLFGFLIDTDSDTRPEAQTQDMTAASNSFTTDNPNLFGQQQQEQDPAVTIIRNPSSVDRTSYSRLILRPVDGLGFETTTTLFSTVDLQPTAGPLSNRFGDDDTPVTTSTTQRPPVVVQQTQPTTTQRPVVVRQTTTRPPTQRTTSRFNFQQQPQPSNQGGQPAFVPNNVIDNFFIPPGQQNPQQNNGGGAQSPIVGLFNQIGNKLATTADAIAGMLRKTVDVIVTSHIQSHQRALRSFGAQ